MEPEKVESAQPEPVDEPKAIEIKWWWWLILGILAIVIAIGLFRIFNPTPITNPVSPLATPIANPANPLVTPIANPVMSESTTLDFGSFGSYHAVMDNNRKMYTLGFWNESMVSAGTKNLADLKRDGGTISFAMPADGWINNSAGELLVDNQKWALGNYGENPQEATLIKKGQIVKVIYGPGNDSAGFQLWFK